MPGGGYGGDSSVIWYTDADDAREAHSEPRPGTGKPRKHHQDGIDATTAGQRTFTISIMIPKDIAKSGAKADFQASLQAAANAVAAAAINSGGVVRIVLPIEDVGHGGPNPDQIKVDW